MKNELEKLKAQQAEMLKKMEEINDAIEHLKITSDETDDGEVYTFTKEEMVAFVRSFHSAFLEAAEETINDMDFNDSCYYDLSLHGNEIEVEIDSNTIAGDIITEMDMDNDDDVVLDSINSAYNKVKKEL